MTANRSLSRVLAVAATLLLIVSLAGCGGGSSTKGKVKGKVMAGGKPVTEGAVLLQPMAGTTGTQASGAVGADGTFEITTEKPGDGAAIGKHSVMYSAPGDEQAEWDGYGKPPPVKSSPFKNMVSSVTEFEVKAGDNTLDIELTPARPLR